MAAMEVLLSETLGLDLDWDDPVVMQAVIDAIASQLGIDPALIQGAGASFLVNATQALSSDGFRRVMLGILVSPDAAVGDDVLLDLSDRDLLAGVAVLGRPGVDRVPECGNEVCETGEGCTGGSVVLRFMLVSQRMCVSCVLLMLRV
jgi:hypothetical protein